MIKTDDDVWFLAEVAGHGHGYLAFRPGPTRCGKIEDGIAWAHWKVTDPKSLADAEGNWVVSFADLEEMYLAAKAVRERMAVASEAGEPNASR